MQTLSVTGALAEHESTGRYVTLTELYHYKWVGAPNPSLQFPYLLICDGGWGCRDWLFEILGKFFRRRLLLLIKFCCQVSQVL